MNIASLHADEVSGFDDLNRFKRQLRDLELKLPTLDNELRKLAEKKRTVGNKNVDAEENVSRVLNDEDVSIDNDLDSQLRRQVARCNATRDAIHLLKRQILSETRKAGRKICDDIKPTHDALRTELAEAVANAFSIYMKTVSLRQRLINSGAGLNGLFNNLPDLGAPAQRDNSISIYLRREKAEGFLRQRLPAEIA